MSAIGHSSVLLCGSCGKPLRFDAANVRACCEAPNGSILDGTIVRHHSELVRDGKAEMRVRDEQADGYLQHRKFPIQVYRFREFAERVAGKGTGLPVLDLGCGPGPTTAILLEHGFDVVSVDISLRSLQINQDHCRGHGNALFVHADLTRIDFAQDSVGGLMMADFLQHLGDAGVQRTFLSRAFKSLVPGGWFFLSVLNVNVKHRLKGDIDGAYMDGQIPYHRFTLGELMGLLPPGIEVTRIQPMNVFHEVNSDRIASRLPFARHLARMMVLCGQKRE